jgi:hypothetical protein
LALFFEGVSVADKQEVNPSDEMVERIASSVAAAVSQATIQVQERISPLESRHSSKVSSFNPEGLKERPKLRARVIFGGGEMKEKFLTNDEIAALNSITEPGDYQGGRWHVRIRKDDSNKETIMVDFPSKTIDDRMELPRSMKAIIDTILAEVAQNKKTAALKAKQ